MKKKLILLIMLLLSFIKVRALSYGGCEYSRISKLKSYVTNVNVLYNYRLSGNSPIFSVTLTNITPEMYFIDSYSGETYFYNNTNAGEITITNYYGNGGQYNFYSNIGECYGIKLGTKYYKFPTYNVYYGSEVCKDIPEYSLCQKWIDNNYDYYTFYRLASEYKESLKKEDKVSNQTYKKTVLDNIVDFYINNYMYFLGIIVIICATIILIDRKKNRFKL